MVAEAGEEGKRDGEMLHSSLYEAQPPLSIQPTVHRQNVPLGSVNVQF